MAATPHPVDPALLADSPYGPDGFFIDQVLEIDREHSLIRLRMPTRDDDPLTGTQRAHPVHHPRHVAGGLMIHVTGIAAFIHGWYLLDLRHADGWIGYGVRITDARFLGLIPPGEPLEITCRMLHKRGHGPRRMIRYAFEFFQDGKKVYTSQQTAMFVQTREAA